MVRVRMPARLSDRHGVKVRLRRAGLLTVCEEARCPNMGECFGAQTATFLVLGEVCTRRCRFCAISKDDSPQPVDVDEPRRVASAVRELGLSHAVITSVTRDDLPDGGASHFASCIHWIRRLGPDVSVEVLVPDFAGNLEALRTVLDAGPEVFNHNIETVPRLYPLVRPRADFERSLGLLAQAAGHRDAPMLVKSGIMVGLGEEEQEVVSVLALLKRAGCQVVTIGQYLRPTRTNIQVARQVAEEEFSRYRQEGRRLGLQVVAGPLVRSSYRAREILIGVKAASYPS